MSLMCQSPHFQVGAGGAAVADNYDHVLLWSRTHSLSTHPYSHTRDAHSHAHMITHTVAHANTNTHTCITLTCKQMHSMFTQSPQILPHTQTDTHALAYAEHLIKRRHVRTHAHSYATGKACADVLTAEHDDLFLIRFCRARDFKMDKVCLISTSKKCATL